MERKERRHHTREFKLEAVRLAYSFTEISAVGGKAHVKSRQTRFEDGKLTTETFEGDVDRTEYDRMVGDAQRRFLDQTALLLKSFWLLPFLRNPSSDRD